jgi:hypothetical protein
MAVEFTWADVWNYCQHTDEASRQETIAFARSAILSMKEQDRVKALVGAPEELKDLTPCNPADVFWKNILEELEQETT